MNEEQEVARAIRRGNRRLLAWSCVGVVGVVMTLWAGLEDNWIAFLPSVLTTCVTVIVLGSRQDWTS